MNNGVEVRASTRNGSGLFAVKDFAVGEAVYSFEQGRIVDHHEISELSGEEKMHLDWVGDNKFEIISAPGCFVNHSCDPNIEERDRVGYALRDIKAEEELMIDYDQVSYLESPFACSCGAPNCRKIIYGRS